MKKKSTYIRQQYARKPVSIKLPPLLLKTAQEDCVNNNITFTALIENFLRYKYGDVYKQVVTYEDCSHLDIDNFPANPKVVKIEEVVIG